MESRVWNILWELTIKCNVAAKTDLFNPENVFTFQKTTAQTQFHVWN